MEQYELIRESKYPSGKIALPNPDQITESDWKKIVSISERFEYKNSPGDMASYELAKVNARVLASIVESFGEWDFEDLELGEFQTMFKEDQSKLSVNFVYWLSKSLIKYLKDITDPN